MFVPQGWRMDLVGIDPKDQWATMLDVAQRAEAGPWESSWVYDHFHTVPLPSEEATHEAWSLMAAFAAATNRIRLGQMCTCMSYRNPAYLAKVAATIDVISGGRVEMGIGAGWYEHEWRAYGYGFPSAGERLAALDEGVQIMRQMWTEGRATLDGRIYQVDGAIGRPLPLQENGIPLWIAGGGERKTLRTAAKYASYTNFDGSVEGFRHKSTILAEHCRDLGRDFGEITRSADYNVIIGANQAEVDDRLAFIREHYTRLAPSRADSTYELYRTGPLVGTPEQIVDALRELEREGMTYAICYFVDAAFDPASVELFQREVIPALAS
jgi:F420-dependent oxidoreductase-like protein